MANAIYTIQEKPEYQREIPAITTQTPAHADTVLRPLFESVINNTEYVRQRAEEVAGELDEAIEGLTPLGIGAIPTTEKAKVGGVATLDSSGKVPAGQLPDAVKPSQHAGSHKMGGSDALAAADVGADPAGSAATVKRELDIHAAAVNPHKLSAVQVGAVPKERKINGRALTADIVLTQADLGINLDATIAELKASMPTYIYKCTGTADSTAIAAIVNDFFRSGTAMSMKLVISGTMGIAFTSTYYAMNISASNSRGAVCHLDFSDCDIPKITTADRDFLRVTSATARLNVTSLVVSTTRYGVFISSAKTVNFLNCHITGTMRSVYLTSTSSYNNFIGCTLAGGYSGVYIDGSSDNKFSCCYISSIINSDNNCINVSGTCHNNLFSDCTIRCSAQGMGGGTSCGFYLAGAAENINLRGCTIRSWGNSAYLTNGNGIVLSSAYTGTVTVDNCKVFAETYGISATTAHSAAMVKLTNSSISGGIRDVDQSTSASTMSWYVVGNSFAKSTIRINGGDKGASTTTTNAYLYMPAHANFFGRTVELP